MEKVARITFDGVLLKIIGTDGTVIDTVFAVSGAEGFQSPEDQFVDDFGTAPEGRYYLDTVNIREKNGIVIGKMVGGIGVVNLLQTTLPRWVPVVGYICMAVGMATDMVVPGALI